ncbi:hypothetical protein V8E36_008547 [Tilletia maclaganii]
MLAINSCTSNSTSPTQLPCLPASSSSSMNHTAVNAGTVSEHVITIAIGETLPQPGPTPVPALDQCALSTGAVFATTKTCAGTTTRALRTLANAVDEHMPTVLCYCRNMPQICENTRRAGAIAGRITWPYNAEDSTSGNRRSVCPSPVGLQCQARNWCDHPTASRLASLFIATKHLQCYFLLFSASFLNDGRDAVTIRASIREQKAQGIVLSDLSRLIYRPVMASDTVPLGERFVRVCRNQPPHACALAVSGPQDC